MYTPYHIHPFWSAAPIIPEFTDSFTKFNIDEYLLSCEKKEQEFGSSGCFDLDIGNHNHHHGDYQLDIDEFLSF